MVISSSLSGSALFSRFNGFLGTINESALGQLTSVRLYFTRRWASVATVCRPSLLSSKNTPVMAGRRSSVLTANKVLLMAVTNAVLVMVKLLVSSADGSLGKLSGFSPITLYLPLSLVISTAKFLSMVKVSGWSAILFNESIKIFAGIQTRPL